jgi:dipeptidyl aminopeptidase/acylaminoacyl peptidase
MRKAAFLTTVLAGITATAQVKTEVTEFNLTGPFPVETPFAADSVDVQGKAFDSLSLLTALPLQSQATKVFTTAVPGAPASGAALPALDGSMSVGTLTFYVNNTNFLKGNILVKGPKNFKLYIDGEEATPAGPFSLAPEHHTFTIRYLAEPNATDSATMPGASATGLRQTGFATDSIRVTLDTPSPIPPGQLTINAKHPYMVHDMLDGRRVRGISISPDGQYVCLSYQTVERDGKSSWDFELRQTKNQQLVRKLSQSVNWMPRSVAWIEDTKENGIRILYKVEPLTGQRTRWAAGLPDGNYSVSPTEDYLIVTAEEEGPKEDDGVFQVIEMDDRQPGWRKRRYLVRFDVKTGVSQRITFGSKGQFLADISADGQKLLVGASYSRLAKRPTEVGDYFILDAHTLKADTLLLGEGFLSNAQFSPDGRQILFTGTPEAFNRIGCQLPADKTPSMTENELFIYDIATRKVTPLTKAFDPSIQHAVWSKADGKIYFNAEDRDYMHMFVLDPSPVTRHSSPVTLQKLPCCGDNVFRFDLADNNAAVPGASATGSASATIPGASAAGSAKTAHNTPVLAYLSDKTMEPASAYVMHISSKRQQPPLFDGKTALGDAELGTCEDWNFQNSNGDTVYGRMYLPRDFDATKKYPMIVYYYGGCSPVTRSFETRYPAQYYASLGYVVYILQPSGATGFGQEWASRHVNTAGGAPKADAAAVPGASASGSATTPGASASGSVPAGTPAGDIIEGTRRICAEHPFIDDTKIGCMGASYGGFMTMYLQTVTDIFAAAVSHAGIANHTSYWGEGYWGYNYSEVSMANSYPWSHRQLYVDQSPLFRADKIHTPLLLLHGNADTNVPLIESLQMFTALKLLGREVALVEVEGENHHILDYKKRTRWMATQMAWFQRWLKGDSSWWDALYPQKHL